MKRFIVVALEKVCCLFHWAPPHKCRCAVWSNRLDARWGLGEWLSRHPTPDQTPVEDE